MHEIKVMSISTEEAEHGVAELWADGQQIAYTVYEDGELKMRFEPRHDGTPVAISVRSSRTPLPRSSVVLAGSNAVAATLRAPSNKAKGTP